MSYKDTWFYRYIGSAIAHPKNFFFCLKYPFMKSRNVWSSRFSGYKYTAYDEILDGWQIAFGKQLLADIVQAFKANHVPKRKWTKTLRWEQIKEKYGELCLYASAPDYIQDILTKYEDMSSCYCCRCGKPAKYWSTGWICPFCEDCKNDLENQGVHCNEMHRK